MAGAADDDTNNTATTSKRQVRVPAATQRRLTAASERTAQVVLRSSDGVEFKVSVRWSGPGGAGLTGPLAAGAQAHRHHVHHGQKLHRRCVAAWGHVAELPACKPRSGESGDDDDAADDDDDDAPDLDPVDVPNVNSATLKRVIEFCEHAIDNPVPEIPKPLLGELREAVGDW
ncbi:MAG: hypothetical protein AAFS07_18985 [Pseudomonadota bacterium]